MSPRKRSPRNAKNKYGAGACPIIVGKNYEVDVCQMSPQGEGMARIKGFIVFIENANLGDHLMVEITNLNSISADAKIISNI